MRILVVSDIHGNRVALEAVLKDAGTVDAVWSLGDVVGYGPEPSWCVDRIIELCEGAPSLSGNHDLAAVGKLDIQAFNVIARAATTWTAAQLSSTQRRYLEQLPSCCIENGYSLVHGSPRAPAWEYITDAATARQNFDLLTTDVCFVGHTHQAAISECDSYRYQVTHGRWKPGEVVSLEDRRLILNPGSVGQPRDGDPRAAYAILNTSEGHVTLHRTPYDIESVQRRMQAVGLPHQLADRLTAGR